MLGPAPLGIMPWVAIGGGPPGPGPWEAIGGGPPGPMGPVFIMGPMLPMGMFMGMPGLMPGLMPCLTGGIMPII